MTNLTVYGGQPFADIMASSITWAEALNAEVLRKIELTSGGNNS